MSGNSQYKTIQHEEVARLNKGRGFLGKLLDRKIRLFHNAAGSGDVEFTKFLTGIEMDVNADLKIVGGCQSALATAAAGGHLNMVKHLLSKGSHLNPPRAPELLKGKP